MTIDNEGKCEVAECNRCHCDECEFEWESMLDDGVEGKK